MTFLTPETLDKIKNYNRPIRMVIWCLAITFAFLYCVIIKDGKVSEIDPIATNILWGMFGDLGIYSVARTVEKNKSVDADTTKQVTATATANSDTTKTDVIITQPTD